MTPNQEPVTKPRGEKKYTWVWVVIARFTHNPTIPDLIGVYSTSDAAHYAKNHIPSSYELATVYRTAIKPTRRTSL